VAFSFASVYSKWDGQVIRGSDQLWVLTLLEPLLCNESSSGTQPPECVPFTMPCSVQVILCQRYSTQRCPISFTSVPYRKHNLADKLQLIEMFNYLIEDVPFWT